MKKAFAVAALGTMFFAGPASANTALELMKEKGCLMCHSVEAKVIGPAYRDVSKKYKSDKNAVTMLTTQILNGSSGKWGAIPMPANKPKVTEQDATTLAKFIMSL